VRDAALPDPSAATADPMNSTQRTHCPICGKPADLLAEPLGPFCSKRCKIIDLGKWFGEEYKISEPLRPEHFAGFEDLPDGPELDRPATASEYEED